MKKYYNDKGEVAVLVSQGWGAGWSTWGHNEQQVFSPELVQAVLDGMPEKDLKVLGKKLFPDDYEGGLERMRIEWLAPGTKFYIEEFDGAERLLTVNDLNYTA